jgi:hypothetical protein
MDELRERLLKPRITEDTVDIEGIGTVRVRGLSRSEVFMTQQAKGTEAMERKILALGMVDPPMTEDDVKTWQRNSPAGELDAVANKIHDLSGLGKGADKSGVPDVRPESGDGVRVLPGSEAGDDGGDVEGAAV